MRSGAGVDEVDRIFPKWAASWGALARGNAQVRSQCRMCGIQHRIDAGIMAMRFGAASSPVDQLDACNVVGCHGQAFFLVARSYGRQWVNMLSREDLIEAAEHAAPATNAVALSLVGQAR